MALFERGPQGPAGPPGNEIDIPDGDEDDVVGLDGDGGLKNLGPLLAVDGSDDDVATVSDGSLVGKPMSGNHGVRVVHAPSSITVLGVQNTCTLEQFHSNAGNGTAANDATAMAAAIAALAAGTYTALLLGGKTYTIGGPYTVPAGCTIRGLGASSVLRTTSDAGVLVVGGENVALLAFKILGSASGSSQVGVRVGTSGSSASGYSKILIDGITFDSLGADGFQYNENPFTPYVGPRVSNCLAKSCGTGFRMGTRGEYIAFANCQAESCTLGVYVGAGNVAWLGGVLAYNATNVQIAAGSNSAHGTFSGAHINHPSGSTNIQIDASVSNGWLFSNCNVYGGAITSASAGVRFLGGQVGVSTIQTTGEVLEFCGCTIVGTPTISELSSGQVIFPGCRDLTMVPPAAIGQRQTGAIPWGTEVLLGTDPGYTSAKQTTAIRAYVHSSGIGYMGAGSAAVAFWTASYFGFVQPITGGGLSPYGIHGVASQAMADANQTPNANVYSCGTIKTTGALTADRTLTIPTATDAKGYRKTIWNACTGANVVVSTGAGTTYTVTAGETRQVEVDASGVRGFSDSSGGSFTAGGDLTGSSSSQTVSNLQGFPFTGGGESNGRVLRSNGSAAYWGPVDLTSSNAVTGQLPPAYGGTGLSAVGSANTVATSDGSGFVWQTIVNANVNASAAIAGTKIAPDFGSQNVQTTGTFRYSATKTMMTSNGTELFIACDSAYSNGHDTVRFSTPTTGGVIHMMLGSQACVVISTSTTTVKARPASYGFTFGANDIKSGLPMLGDSGAAASSPYSVHGNVTITMASANKTLSNSEMSYETWRFTGVLGADRTVTIQAPSSGAGYEKDVWVDIDEAATGAGIVLSTGSGKTVKLTETSVSGSICRARISVTTEGVIAIACLTKAQLTTMGNT